jgi:CRP-like cAMP-binding protein
MTEQADTLERLKQVDLFSTLSGRQLKHLAEAGRVVTHNPGDEVLSEGHDGVGFHLILSGGAKVDVAGASRPALGVGDYFGEISVLDGKPRTASVTAGDDGLQTFSLSAWQFATLLEKNPEMAKPIIAGLCTRLRAAEASATEARAAAVS